MSLIFRVLIERIKWVGAADTSKSAVAFSLISRVLILVVNVSTGIIVARGLGPGGRGAAAAIALWPMVFASVLTVGIPAALRYEVRRTVDTPSALFSSALLLSGIFGLLASTIGVLVVPHLLVKYSHDVIKFAQLMLIFTPLILCNLTIQAFFESQSDFRRSSAMIFAPPVLTLMGLVVLDATHSLSPYAVALDYESPFALTTIVMIIKLRKFLRLPDHLSARIQSALHYGLRAYGIDVVDTLAAQIDQAMVIALLSASSFGLYIVAINGARIIAVPGLSINSVLFPKASGLARNEAIATVSRSARLVFVATILVAVVLIALLPVLVPLTYGKQYVSIEGLVRILVVGVVCSATTNTLNQAFMATGRPEIATLLQCVGLSATVPLMFALIPPFGISGAAYAVDISYGVRLAFVLVAYPVFLHQSIPRLLPTRKDINELYGQLRRIPA